MVPSRSALNRRTARKAALPRFWAWLTDTGCRPERLHMCGGRPPAAPRRDVRARLLSGLAAAALLAGGERPALAAPPCVQETERAAFDVRALQSQLMVAALTCERQDDYNTFVQRHQQGLLSAYQGVTSHFRRLHGAVMGEQQRDQYVTELANAQSQEGIRQGLSFCRNMGPLFQGVLTLRDAGEIARFSASRNAPIFYPLAACAPPAAAPVPSGGVAEGRDRDARDDELSRLRARLEQLERALERPSEPAVTVADARTARPSRSRPR
jgi:hypothetical protein